MKTYTERRLFSKYWGWFEPPRDVPGVAIANFFSYDQVDAPGFTRTESLTSVIDLSQGLENIWLGMRESFVRKQIEQGSRRGIEVRPGQPADFPAFYALYRAFSRRMRIGRAASAALAEQGTLFVAFYDGALIAGGEFIGDGEHLRAWVLASGRADRSGRMRDIIGSANRMILWEAIRWAKQNGYRGFDLGGIAPDSSDPHLRGVAAFKEAFGGTRVVSYYYYKVYSPLLRLWMSARRLLRL